MNGKWTYYEHILAFNLYCKIPFSKINSSYPPIKRLAKILGRSNGSVAMKMANFARLDLALKAKNISGLSRGAKGEEVVWNEFNGNWQELAWKSENILADRKKQAIEQSTGINIDDIGDRKGEDRDRVIKGRVNHEFFSDTVKASYDNTCCISGIELPQLLTASHIIPWKDKKETRVNPSNGLCLNALHDRAFDRGLITVNTMYEVRISETIRKNLPPYFDNIDGRKITLPHKFLPNPEYLDWHNRNVFLG